MARAARLTSEHVEQVASLHASYPTGIRQDRERIRQKLALLEQSRFSFSWILLEDGVATGYIVAYPSGSVSSGDYVVCIDDMQVRYGYPKGQSSEFYKLLKLMAEDKEQANLGKLHIEALCRRQAYKVVAEHPQVIGRLGYELLGSHEYWEASVGEEMCLMRWAPIPGATPAQRAANDALVLSVHLMDELALES